MEEHWLAVETMMMAWSATPLRALNVAAFLVLVAGNGWAAAGIAGGESIGVVANRWPTFLFPAGWAFGIWSLICVRPFSFSRFGTALAVMAAGMASAPGLAQFSTTCPRISPFGNSLVCTMT